MIERDPTRPSDDIWTAPMDVIRIDVTRRADIGRSYNVGGARFPGRHSHRNPSYPRFRLSMRQTHLAAFTSALPTSRSPDL